MRPIKFRGKDFAGKLVFGDLTQDNYCGRKNTYIENVPVAPESVAQLIGCDKNGAEVYSDDKVIDSSGKEVFFKDVFIKFSEIGGKFDDLTLKG